MKYRQYWLARMARERRMELGHDLAFWASLATFAAIVIIGMVQ